VRPTPGQACPLYAELLPRIVATTGSAAFAVHLPADGCQHVLSSVNATLGAVIAAEASPQPGGAR
jgi:hypothetical protein